MRPINREKLTPNLNVICHTILAIKDLTELSGNVGELASLKRLKEGFCSVQEIKLKKVLVVKYYKKKTITK